MALRNGKVDHHIFLTPEMAVKIKVMGQRENRKFTQQIRQRLAEALEARNKADEKKRS